MNAFQRCRVGILVWLCISCASPSWADSVAHDSGYWTTTSFNLSLAPKWSAGLLVQTRAREDFDHLERTVLRPSLTYKLFKDTWLTAGYDAHFIKLNNDTLEQRTWQQLMHIWHLPRVSLSGRVRMEERFIEDIGETAYRLRLKARVDVPIAETKFKLTLSNEYFIGLNDVDRGPREGFDQNRAYAGVSHPISDKISASLGYQAQHINRGSGADDLLVHQVMVGLSLKH